LETVKDRNSPATAMANLGDPQRGTKGTKVDLPLVVSVILLLGLPSRGSTQLSHVWLDPSFVAGPLKKILVIAVRQNQQSRRAWEDGFVTSLSGHGVDVTASYSLFPEALPDTGLIHSITSARGFDGIILVGRVSTGTTESVTPRMDIASPAFPPSPLDASYSAYSDREYYPGYPVVDDVVKDEVGVWTTRGVTRMIWTGVCEDEDSDLRQDARREIIHLVLPELVKQGVVAPGS
jgi:hypothetical protein